MKRDPVKEAAAKFRQQMQQDSQSRVPSITAYLATIEDENREALLADLMETFSTESGLRVLKLMEKSILMVAVPTSASDGALRELNGVRNFVLEIRRLVANG